MEKEWKKERERMRGGEDEYLNKRREREYESKRERGRKREGENEK